MKKIWKSTVENAMLAETLRVLSTCATLFTAYAGVFVAAPLFEEEVWQGVKFLAVLAVPFVLVSVLRRILNFPRPYDVYPDLFGDTVKKHPGKSLPSRHAFSAFAIATLLVPFSLPFALGAFGAAVVIFLCRLFLGYHFARDLFAGAAVGVLSSVLGILLIL